MTDVVRRALELEGAPFHRQGRSPLGVSCDGVVSYAFGIAGTALDFATHRQESVTPGLVRQRLAHAGFVEVDGEPEVGHVLVFRRPNSEVEDHLAVMVEPDRFLHVRREPGVCQRTRLDDVWRSLLSGVFARCVDGS